jgi:hypothetical protein
MARVPGTTRRRRGEILVGLPVIDDDWDEDVKNAVAIRNQTWVDRKCVACGATIELTAYPPPGVVGVSFVHADGCPVTELLLDPQEP